MNAEGAPLIVYCEIGAVTKVVKDLINRGVIQIIHGPYEGRLKRRIPAMPSRVTADSTWFTIDSTFRISDLEHSSKHSDIVRIIGGGKRTRMDALHLDSAHKYISRVPRLSSRPTSMTSFGIAYSLRRFWVYGSST
jgi:hypothetical protein